jgi:hypothetical protein
MNRDKATKHPHGDATRIAMDPMTADRHAYYIARDMHRNHQDSHLGTGEWNENGVTVGFYCYDNHPYMNYPGLRSSHYADLVTYLATRGCRLTSRGHYPARGEDAGYTIAMTLVSASPERAQADHDAARDYLRQRLAEPLPTRPEHATAGPSITKRART